MIFTIVKFLKCQKNLFNYKFFIYYQYYYLYKAKFYLNKFWLFQIIKKFKKREKQHKLIKTFKKNKLNQKINNCYNFIYNKNRLNVIYLIY